MKLGDLLFGIKVDQGKLKVETAKIKAEMKGVGDSVEKNLSGKTIGGMEKKLSELNKELKLVKVGTKEFKSLQKEIKKTEKALDKANGKSSIFAKGLKLMSGLAIGAGIANVAKSVVTLGANLEQAQISFEVMLGSAEKANYLLKELTDFAAKTPFELVGLRQDAKLLLAMGVQMEELIPTMTILGNAASGLSVDFNRLALAYGQVQAKGKLQGGELKQFTEAGVPLIKVLGEELGVTSEEFYKMVEAGQISSDAVTRAFQIMSEEGGVFYNLMDRQSETLGGTWSNLKDSAASLGEGIGLELIPFMKGLVQILNALIEIVPVVGAAFKFTFTLISSTILDAVYGSQLAINNFVVFFQKTGNNISGFASDLGANIGRAFSMVPNAIKNSLNKGLENIEKFLNAAIDGVNNFARKFGIDQAIGKVSLGRANVDFTAGEAGFTSSGRDYAAEKNAIISAEQDIYRERKELARQFNMDRLVDSSDTLAKQIDIFRNGAKQIEKETGGSVLGDLFLPEDSAGGSSSDGEKAVEEALKKEEERIKRREEFLKDQEKKRNDRLKDQLEFVTDTVTEITDVIDDEIKTSEDNIDSYIDKIDDLNDTIKNLEEESAGVKDDLFDFGSVKRQKELERYLKRYGKALESVGNDASFGDVTAGELRDFQKLKNRQQEIEDEKLAAEQEINELTAKKEQEQEILQEYQEKRKIIDDNYLNYRQGIEKQITDEVFIQAAEQESIQDKLISKWKKAAAARREALGTQIQDSGVPGFKVGGYTGSGNPNEVAGDVHKDEFVVNSRTLRKNPGLIADLQKIQNGGSYDYSRNASVGQMIVNNQLDVITAMEKLAFRM